MGVIWCVGRCHRRAGRTRRKLGSMLSLLCVAYVARTSHNDAHEQEAKRRGSSPHHPRFGAMKWV